MTFHRFAPERSSEQPSTGFRAAARRQESVLAPLERKCLDWLARRMPAWVQPDHLTLLGLTAMILAGASCAAARWWPPSLLVVGVCLAVNWFGDSLDGTLARVRVRQRPRYGFYVDHMVDSLGALFLIAGMAASGYMSERIAAGVLLSYLLLAIDAYLAAYTLGIFPLSFGKLSPTELRILLSIGFAIAWLKPDVNVFGVQHKFLDVGGVVAVISMVLVLLVSVLRNTLALYRMERV